MLARRVREFQVYVVEVCLGCHWNHLVEQFLVGSAVAEPALAETDTPRRKRRAQAR